MKNLVPVVVVLLLLGVGGYLFMSSQKSKPSTTVTTQETTKQGGNIFTSIQDALSKSLSLKCDYLNPDGKGGTVTSYIKNGAIRVSNFAMGTQGSVIMKNNKMWFWDDVKKTGMIYSYDLSNTITGPAGSKQVSQNVVDEIEKYKNYCKTEVVADSLFTPPSDVKFTDLLNVMKGFAAPSGVIPSGVIIPSQVQEPNQ